MAKNCDNCGHCYIENVIHVCGRNEGRLPLFDGDGNCKGWKKKHITKLDRIRSMSDEELAEWLACNCDCASTCMAMKSCCAKSEKDCVQAWKEWLRQECAE